MNCDINWPETERKENVLSNFTTLLQICQEFKGPLNYSVKNQIVQQNFFFLIEYNVLSVFFFDRWFHGVHHRTPGPLLRLEQVEAHPEDAFKSMPSLVLLLARRQGLQGHKDLALSLPRVRRGRPRQGFPRGN